MLGTIVNAAAIALGAILGFFIGNKFEDRYLTVSMQASALVCLLIGLQMASKGEDILIILVSLALGGLLGELIDLDKHMNLLGNWLERKLGGGNISRGFVFATVLFCTGSMGVVGAIQGGLEGRHDILLLKAAIDALLSIALGATLGIGVLLSGFAVLIYQGLIALGAGLVRNILTEVILTDITAVGGLLIVTIAINMFFPDKIKTANFLPAVFIPVIWHSLALLF